MTYTLKRLAAQMRASVTYGARKDYDKQDDWQRGAHGYTVTLSYRRRRMTVDFYMGQAHTKEPTALDVLECLLSDASSADQDFDSWCGDMGFDVDSRRAERIYQETVAQTEKLKSLLGDDYETFLNAERS